MYIDKWLNEVRKILMQNIDLEKYNIFLFGSFARGDYREDSDIDIGIEGNTSMKKEVLNKIRYQLEDSIVPNKVEIVDFSRIENEEFRKSAMRDKKVWNKAKDYH